MNIIFEIMGVCTLFGLALGLLVSFSLSKKENGWFALICSIVGTTIGFWYSIIWMALTGATKFSPLMLFGDIITVTLALLVAIPLINETHSYFKKIHSDKQTVLSLIIIVGIALFFMISFVPTYSSANGKDFDVSYNGVYTRKVTVDDDFIDEILEMNSCTDCSKIPVEMSFIGASSNFPWFTADPKVNDYMGFDITFDVGTSGGSWMKPYVKIFVVHDEDGSGSITEGDTLWSPQSLKIVTSNSKWRSTLVYENGAPWSQLHFISTSGGILYFPIFHANTITSWKDDDGKHFSSNTPEGYTSPHDQLSFDKQGSSLYLKEDITKFAVINRGASSTIEAKLYCPNDYKGTNIIWVGVYDMNFQTNPYSLDLGDPLIYKTEKFTIGTDPGPNDSDGDGVIDSLDNCPNTYNPGQEDDDGDGIGNACDTNGGGGGVTPPDVSVDISTYLFGASLTLGCLGAVVAGKKYL